MLKHCLAVALLAASTGDLMAAKPPKKAAPKPAAVENRPVVSVLHAELAAAVAALEKSQGQFTPEARAAFVAGRRAQAVAELASHQITLPASLLDWVDADAEVAATVYGIRYGTPAQALFILRSLDLDLGTDTLKKYKQIALAAAWHNAATVSFASPGPGGFSVTERRPVEVKIPPCPLRKVDTHPTDRPMDMNDHIINFLEEEEEVAGKEIVTVKPRTPILTAGQVVNSSTLQKQLNGYMAKKWPKFQPLACEQANTLASRASKHPSIKQLAYAAKLFYTAYVAKGRLPDRPDPLPTATQWITYHISNAENPKRRVNLNKPWPVLLYLLETPIPLREAEFVWNEEIAKGLNPTRYIMYIGPIGQYNKELIMITRMRPSEFAFQTYPGKRYYGGVCGTHTYCVLKGGAAMGLSFFGCSSPGHSFPGNISYGKTGYACTGGNTSAKWYFGPSRWEGGSGKMQSLVWAMNYGHEAFSESQLAWTAAILLTPHLPRQATMNLLKSAVTLNPYNQSLVRAAVPACQTQAELFEFWTNFRAAVDTAKAKPGCPQGGGLIAATWSGIAQGLEKLPVPEDKTLATSIYGRLTALGCSPTLLVRYQGQLEGLDATLAATGTAFQRYLASNRSLASSASMKSRLENTVALIQDPQTKKDWAAELQKSAEGLEKFLNRTGHPKLGRGRFQVVNDAAIEYLMTLSGNRPTPEMIQNAFMAQVTRQLGAHLASKRNSDLCQEFSNSLTAAFESAKAAHVDLAPWVDRWYKLSRNKHKFARFSWCVDRTCKLIDQWKKDYPLSARQELAKLTEEVEALNNDNAGGKNQDRINALQDKSDTLTKQLAESAGKPNSVEP